MPAKSIIQMPIKPPDNDKAFRKNGLFKQQTAFPVGAYAKGQLAKAPFPVKMTCREGGKTVLCFNRHTVAAENAERPIYLVEQAAAYESAGIAFCSENAGISRFFTPAEVDIIGAFKT